MLLVGVMFSASRVHAASRDPAVDGKDYLLPQSELHALLAVAQRRLATVAPGAPIYRVTVISASKVEARYRDRDLDQSDPAWLVVERIQGHWRVTASKPRTNRPVVKWMQRPSQTIQPTAVRAAITLVVTSGSSFQSSLAFASGG
jgi:hypothetical protein